MHLTLLLNLIYANTKIYLKLYESYDLHKVLALRS